MNTIIETARAKFASEHPGERAEAVRLLHKIPTHPEAVALLCRTLHDPDASIRQQAAQALIPAFSQAYTVVFRNHSVGMTQRDLNVQVLETLLLPRKIIIDPNTCDLRQVEAFAAFTLPGFSRELLAQFTVFIEGNPTPLASPIYRIFQHCNAVEIAIETVSFGDVSVDAATCWHCPDVRYFQLPLRRLRHIEIDATTAAPLEIERFLTYALEYMGQDFLRRNVTAHLHGSLDAFPSNLRNNLSNLCKKIVSCVNSRQNVLYIRKKFP